MRVNRMPTTMTTITLSTEVKDKLAQAKGGRSWDEFLGEVAEGYLDEAIALAQRRLDDLRAHKARSLSLADVRALRAERGRPARQEPDRDAPASMDARRPSRSRPRPRRSSGA